MDNLRQLVGVEIASVVALLLVASLAALSIHAVEAALYGSAYDGALRSWFLGILLIGAPVAVLYGAPSYFFLRKRAWARWPAVLAVGALPAVCLFPMAPLGGLLGLVCGMAIASLTHILCRHRV